jgi:hypothetical protein
MHKLTIAATIAFGTFLAVAPANAEHNFGPVQQNGQCWQTQVNNAGSNLGTWGYWAACPQKASVAVAPARTHRAKRHASR